MPLGIVASYAANRDRIFLDVLHLDFAFHLQELLVANEVFQVRAIFAASLRDQVVDQHLSSRYKAELLANGCHGGNLVSTLRRVPDDNGVAPCELLQDRRLPVDGVGCIP